jgi:hypothetical protein
MMQCCKCNETVSYQKRFTILDPISETKKLLHADTTSGLVCFLERNPSFLSKKNKGNNKRIKIKYRKQRRKRSKQIL